ncbi:hypothetical protein ACROYT_G041497 [Oculina patagonica]
MAWCSTFYHGEASSSSTCQCSQGLTGDGSYCSESLKISSPLSTSNLRMTPSATVSSKAEPQPPTSTPLLSSINSSPKIKSLMSVITSSTGPGTPSSATRTEGQADCSSDLAHCIKLENSSCVCYCLYVAKGHPGFQECLGRDSDILSLPEVKMLNLNKQPFIDIVRRDEERMFQASIEGEDLTTQPSFAWFIRNVTTMPYAISKNRTLVKRDALTWSPPSGSLTTGLKLIEFEVKLPNVTAVRRDFGFIKVEEPSLVVLINGGSETLISSKGQMILNASHSFDPGVGNNEYFGMSFSWSCFNGGKLLPHFYSGDKRVVVPSEAAKKNASHCSRRRMSIKSEMAASVQPRDNHIYYIRLVATKDQRHSEFLRTLYAVDQDVIRVAIRCIKNCEQMVIPSHRFSLKVGCAVCRPKYDTFSWKLYTKGVESNGSVTVWHLNETLKSLISTKPNSKNIVFKEDKLAAGSSYRLTVDVQQPDGTRGWAAYEFKTATTPSGGICSGVQRRNTQAFGISLYVNCTGWSDDNEPFVYEFFQRTADGHLHMLRYSVMPFGEVEIPQFDSGEVAIKVVIINSLAARTETNFTVRVVQPSWLSDIDGGLLDLEHTVGQFDEYLIQGNMYDAWQLGLVLAQAANMGFDWITQRQAKDMKDHIIQEMSKSNVEDVQSILLLSSVLYVSTSIPEDLTPSSKEIALHVLHDWVRIIKERIHSGRGKDHSLERHAWNVLLHSSGNILHAITQRVTESESERLMMKQLQRHALNLNDVISDAALKSKMTGEEYSSMKTKHHSLILGKHEVHEMDSLQVTDEGASFIFPEISDDMTERVFGKASNVHVQMISYNVNPHSIGGENFDEISSKVISLTLKDENGNEINISNLHSPISLTVPLKSTENKTLPAEEYTVPDVMLYRVFTENRGNSLVELSFKLERPAPFEVYVKYGARPTKDDYDYFTTLDVGTCQNEELSCNVSTDVWFEAERQGKYFIGLLQKSSGRERRSASKIDDPDKDLQRKVPKKRMSRSVSQLNNPDEELCVKFKDPPTPQPVLNVTAKTPAYDPETSVNFTMEVDSAGCLYWSETKEQWMSDGCKAGTNSTSSSLQCLCDHLTSFGGYFLVTPNTIDFDQVQVGVQTIDNPDDVIVLVTVLLVFLLYLMAVIFARRVDKRDLDKVNHIMPLPSSESSVYQYKASITTGAWRNSGTSAKVCMILYGTETSSGVIELSCNHDESRKPFSRGNTDNFLFSVDQPIGPLVKIQVGHDNSGEDPSWFLNEISITDIQANSSWKFPCYRWLGLELEDGSTTLELYTSNVKRSNNFKTSFTNARSYGLANDHMWFSVATKEPRDPFTRVQRLTCCCFFLLWGMLVSALFYSEDLDETRPIHFGPFEMTTRELSVSITTALIAFPPTFFIVFLFRKSQRPGIAIDEDGQYDSDGSKRFKLPRFFVYVAWFLCVVGSLLASVFTILFSLQWGGEKSARWLSSIFLSTTGDVFVSQPIKIIVLSVILSLGCTRKRNQVDDHVDGTETAHTNNSETMFNMAEVDIDQQRKCRVTERKTNIFVRDMIFSCFFLVLLIIVCYGDKSDDRYHIATTTRNDFTKIDKIRNTVQLWKWLDDVFVPAVYAGEWYNGQKETKTEYIGNKRSILVGMPRLRQLRVLKDSCDVPELFKNSISSCYDFYSEEKEDKFGWRALSNTTSLKWSSIVCPENWKYRTADDIDSHKTKGVHSFYSGGGYVANLGYDDSTGRRILKDLANNSWTDRQTRAVLVELSMFNAATNLLVDATLFFEMPPSGFLGTSLKIQVIPMAKSDSASTEAYLVIALLFAFVLGYYLVTECIRVGRLKCAYFKSIWNWFEMLQIISAFLVVAISIERERRTLQVLQKLEENPFVAVSFHDALLWFEIENHIICCTLIIATLRLLRLLKFNNHIIVLFLAVRKSLKPTMSYAIVFTIIFIAYGHAGFLLFGKNVFMFSSFYRITASQFLMCLGAFIPRYELENVHFIFARLYAFSFLFITMIILINMFVAILNEAHSDSISSDQDSEDMEVANLLLSKFLKFVGITKQRQEDSSVNGENETSIENMRRKTSGSSTQPSPDEETEELEFSVKVDMGMNETETNWPNERSEQFRSSLSPDRRESLHGHVMPSTSRSSCDESSKIGGLLLTERKALPSISWSSFHSESFTDQGTSTVFKDAEPSLDKDNVRMVHFGSDVHVRHFSITSSNLPTFSAHDPSLFDTQGVGTVYTEEKTCKPEKSQLYGESEETATAQPTFQTTHHGNEERKEKIIDFDEVSEWLKKGNFSENVSHTMSELSEEMRTSASNSLQRKRGVVNFDTVSKMIKIKRKARKWKKRARESKTTQLQDRVKRLDKLLYVLD